MTHKYLYTEAEINESTIINSTCTKIGKNVHIGANCVIGFEGFNYMRDKHHIPVLKNHTGGVIIENDVEIHSCTCIDRGLDSDTILHRNVKVDNLVYIAHDVEIGEGSLIAGGNVIGGCVKIGKNCFLGFNVSTKPEITIGDFSMVGMGSVVLYDIPEGEIWCGNPAHKLRDNTFFKEK